jgi:5-amino-6-(5-phosphoribosylamino)uracil reductase
VRVADRPFVLLSCAMSVDGYIDDSSPTRLLLSNQEDLDRVDAERARADGILVGAGTIRRDDPGLQVRSAARRAERRRRGLPPSPLRVTVTAGGDLDPGRHFFAGEAESLVYCPAGVAGRLRERLGDGVAVVGLGERVELGALLEDLAARGTRRLMVEGGSEVLTAFLAQGLADELQLSIAPILVGDGCAPRLVREGRFPQGPESPMVLSEVRRLGDVVLLRYLLSRRP